VRPARGQPISVSSADALARMRDRRAKPPPHGNVKASKAVLLEASNHKAFLAFQKLR
jgi:hypothetical protein